LDDATEHLRVMRSHLERHDLPDATIADAATMRLSAALEALSHLPAAWRTEVFGETWKQMWATRNVIAHGYVDVDHEVIAETVRRDLPATEAAIRVLRARLSEDT
jgi:uncharacterized protein with HEPN domain